MRTKLVPLGRVKAGPDDGLAEGEYLVYPSTFIRRPDSYGDVVKAGAFARTIQEWKDSGNVLPGLFGHRLDDPDFYVSGASDMGEDDHGWWVRGLFDLAHAKAQQVYRLVKGRRLTQLSFAYEVRDEGQVELSLAAGDLVDGKANELRDLDVFEHSFVPRGANTDTSVVAIKADGTLLLDGRPYRFGSVDDLEVKVGRVLAEKHINSLRSAHEAIGAVIAAAEASSDGSAGDAPPGAEDPAGDKAPKARQRLVDPRLALLELDLELSINEGNLS